MMGIPNSGKSTFAQNTLSKLKNAQIITIDELYYETYGYSVDSIPKEIQNSFFKKVYNTLSTSVKKALQSNEDLNLIYDASNLSRRRRRQLYLEMKSLGVERVIIHWLPILPEKALSRNLLRNQNQIIQESDLLRKFAHLQIPRKNVDCDDFEIHTTPLDTTFIDRVKELKNSAPHFYMWEMDWLKDSSTKRFLMQNVVSHDSPYHLESVDMHIDMVNEEAYKIDSNNLTLRFAAFFHDLGKGQVKGKDYLDNTLGQFKSHDNVGAQFSMIALHQAGILSDPQLTNVPELIGKHMLAHNLGPNLSKKVINRDNLSQDFLDNLKLLNLADDRGRVLLGKVSTSK